MYFGVALYAASTGVLVLAAGPQGWWFWWSALGPLSLSHWAVGYSSMRADLKVSVGDGRLSTFICAGVSGAITLFTIFVAVGMARLNRLFLSGHAAGLVLFVASLAGVLGLGLVARRLPVSRQKVETLRYRRRRGIQSS
jgi:Co/Zn/Cd efflux system component